MRLNVRPEIITSPDWISGVNSPSLSQKCVDVPLALNIWPRRDPKGRAQRASRRESWGLWDGGRTGSPCTVAAGEQYSPQSSADDFTDIPGGVSSAGRPSAAR